LPGVRAARQAKQLISMPGLPFWLPGHQRVYYRSPPLGPFFHPFHPQRLRRVTEGPALPRPGTGKPKVASFSSDFPYTSPSPFLPSPGLPGGRRALSHRHRQRRAALWTPPHRRPEQSPRRMTLHHQEPARAGIGPNTLPVAVFSTLVSAPARLSRNRPGVKSPHASAARPQPPGVSYSTRIFRGWRYPGRRPRPHGPTALPRNVLGVLAGRGGPERSGSAPRGRSRSS